MRHVIRKLKYIAVTVGVLIFTNLFLLEKPANALCITNATPNLLYFSLLDAGATKGVGGILEPITKYCCPKEAIGCRGKISRISLNFPVDQDGLKLPKSAKKINKALAKLILRKGARMVTKIARFLPMSGEFGNYPPIRACTKPHFKIRTNADVTVYGEMRKSACDVLDQWEPGYIRTFKSRPEVLARSNIGVCNRTKAIEDLNVIVAYYNRNNNGNGGNWTATGYYNAKRGRCTRIAIGDQYYNGDVYYRITGGGKTWSGKKDAYFCINEKKGFTQLGADKKCPRGMKKAGFFKRKVSSGNRLIDISG